MSYMFESVDDAIEFAEGNTNGLIAVIDEEIGSCVKEILYDEI